VSAPRRLYTIRIMGRLGTTALSAFPTMAAELKGDETVLTGVLADQSAVFGVLAQIEALGLMGGQLAGALVRIWQGAS
jgi:hypothetical protein